MSKKFSRILAVTAASVMAVSAMSISASAAFTNQKTQANATFRWGPCAAKMINDSTSSRYTQAAVDVYNDITGLYVTTIAAPDEGVKGFGGSATATGSYSSNGYNFRCRGNIYAASSPSSAINWSPSFTVS